MTRYPASVTNIESRIDALDALASVTVAQLTPPTVDGRKIRSIEVNGGGADSSTPVVMVVGGIHAREWAPPDAVLSFTEMLLAAYHGGTDMIYDSFLDGAVRYAAARVTAAEVQRFVNNTVFISVPLANPDGRHWSLTQNAAGVIDHTGAEWRGNRNIGPTGCVHTGVDVNRNFDAIWNLNPYYTAADDLWIRTNMALDTCSAVPYEDYYRGQSTASEVETQVIQGLIDTFRPQFYMDVHSYGRQISLPWGIANNQTTDASRNYDNPAYHRTAVAGSGRSVKDGTYKEYMPDTATHPLDSWQLRMAERMIRNIYFQAGPRAAARDRSVYSWIYSSDFYATFVPFPVAPLPGASDDYALLRPFRTNLPMAFACTLECGSDKDEEMGFVPPPDPPPPGQHPKFRKIEREVHTAIYTMLDVATSSGVPGSGAPL